MSDLCDRVHAYLKGRPSGVAPEAIAVEVLKLRGGGPGVFERVVASALRDDPRFVRASDGRWGLAPACQTTPSDRATFTVVSLGASGGAPVRVAEVGALRMLGGEVSGRFYRAVVPDAEGLARGEPFQAAGDASAVSVGQALADLTGFATGSTWVADDLRGTLGLLDWEARRSGAGRPPVEGLSLRRLGRRMFPTVKVRSARDLAAALGLSRQEYGRADREADALGTVLAALLDRCRARGVATLEAVLAFQEPDLEGVDFSGYAFDRDFLRSLPERPGVYLMFDRNGVLLYVGKAKSLRDRVGTYFARTTRRSEKMQRFLGRVHELRVEVAGSELEALLIEGRLIRAYRPEVNVQMEVHERAATQPLKDAVFLLPSAAEGCVELFLLREGVGLRQVRAHQDLSDVGGVAAALEEVYGIREDEDEGSEDERADAEIARSWLALHGDGVSRLGIKDLKDLREGVRLLRDYISGCAPTWERVTYV